MVNSHNRKSALFMCVILVHFKNKDVARDVFDTPWRTTR